jgi:hypothetical protein
MGGDEGSLLSLLPRPLLRSLRCAPGLFAPPRGVEGGDPDGELSGVRRHVWVSKEASREPS